LRDFLRELPAGRKGLVMVGPSISKISQSFYERQYADSRRCDHSQEISNQSPNTFKLSVMTFNVGVFVVVGFGVLVGELLFERFSQGTSGCQSFYERQYADSRRCDHSQEISNQSPNTFKQRTCPRSTTTRSLKRDGPRKRMSLTCMLPSWKASGTWSLRKLAKSLPRPRPRVRACSLEED
jgi:hypothetical protein